MLPNWTCMITTFYYYCSEWYPYYIAPFASSAPDSTHTDKEYISIIDLYQDERIQTLNCSLNWMKPTRQVMEPIDGMQLKSVPAPVS